jgi:DNA invertase Pin-like site-specific DNA recombinase
MLVGYARTSTVEQQAGLEAQVRDLQVVGVQKLFHEQVSSVARRAQLDGALDFIREGDTLVVTKLDRLARSVRDLLEIVDRIEKKQASLKILAMNLDTTQPTGRLMLQMLGAVGEFERALMLERQREGIAKAKAAGKYRGRKPTVRARKAEIEELLRAGVGPAEASRRLGIARSSIYRIATIIGAK